MPRFVIKNMVYDTDKMEHIGTVKKWYECQGGFLQNILRECMGYEYDCKLYRSAKGNYLLVHDDSSYTIGEAITETEAKSLILAADYDKYAELFGALEEA